MALNVNVQLNVPPLVDGTDWFVNAAAWTNYWRGLSLAATFDPATNNVYTVVNYDNTLVPYNDGGGHVLATSAMFTSLLNDYNALKTSYENLLTTMKAAGYISNAL